MPDLYAGGDGVTHTEPKKIRTYHDRMVTEAILSDVQLERVKQDALWGEQNHPDGTGSAFAHEAEVAKADTERASRNGTLTWRHILWEEVAEALAESDLAKLRAELIQVAAVAVAQVEHIDRRQAQDGETP